MSSRSSSFLTYSCLSFKNYYYASLDILKVSLLTRDVEYQPSFLFLLKVIILLNMTLPLLQLFHYK